MQQQEYLREQHFPHILCPGCGHGIVLGAIVRAIGKSGLSKNEIVFTSGIGCASRTAGYVDFHTIHTTHGRGLTFATGVAVARPEFKVITVMGDGDATAIGGNHFIHAARRNMNITAIVFNNNIYGMTGGQYSPTTPTGAFASTALYGNVEPAFDVVALSAAAGASFVARGSVTEPVKLERMIQRALAVKGFAIVEAMSTCPTTFGPRNMLKTVESYMNWLKDHTYDRGKEADLAPEARAGKWPLGIFVDEQRRTYVEAYDAEVVPKARAAAAGEAEDAIGPGAHAMPPGRWELVIAGRAGQGIQRLGALLAEAAIRDGNHAAQIENYGPAARTGISLTEVVASGEPIDFPLVETPNVLVAMTQEALSAHRGRVARSARALVLADSSQIRDLPEDVIGVPASATARDEFKLPMASNVVLLGALAALSKIVSLEAAEATVARRVARSREQNLAALRRGYELGMGVAGLAGGVGGVAGGVGAGGKR
ncbi:MAG: 2-oxoacid:acceptor oxidoreductase family protein [Planctomycetes bacterium]|nr:2-oxoacid:acceptor oxidoreductase family protein [Planctomycetota bacterium]